RTAEARNAQLFMNAGQRRDALRPLWPRATQGHDDLLAFHSGADVQGAPGVADLSLSGLQDRVDLLVRAVRVVVKHEQSARVSSLGEVDGLLERAMTPATPAVVFGRREHRIMKEEV